MRDDGNCKLLRLSKSSEKKKKKKKSATSTNTAENAEKLHTALVPPASLLPPWCLSPPQFQPPSPGTTREKTTSCPAAGGRRSKKLRKKSRALRLTEAQETRNDWDEEEGFETEFCIQANESLRWEGELQDPQAEARRLEQYRANRRLRYVAHREAALHDTTQRFKTNFK